MARPIKATRPLTERETKTFKRKVAEGLTKPMGRVPTPRVDSVIEKIMMDARTKATANRG